MTAQEAFRGDSAEWPMRNRETRGTLSAVPDPVKRKKRSTGQITDPGTFMLLDASGTPTGSCGCCPPRRTRTNDHVGLWGDPKRFQARMPVVTEAKIFPRKFLAPMRLQAYTDYGPNGCLRCPEGDRETCLAGCRLKMKRAAS